MPKSYRGLVGLLQTGVQWTVIDDEGNTIKTGVASSSDDAREAIERIFRLLEAEGDKPASMLS